MSEDKKIINDNEEIKTESTTNEESVNNDVVIEEVAENNNGESEEIVQSEEVAEKGIKTKIKKLKNKEKFKEYIDIINSYVERKCTYARGKVFTQ